MKFNTSAIVKTGLLLALCVAVQQFKNLSQFITGPMVNAILIIAVLAVGLTGGLTIAALSPLFSFLISPSPIMQAVPQLIPVIMIGNAILVLCVYLLKNKNLIAGLISGAVLKAAFLWVGVSMLVIPIFGQALKDPQKIALTAMFSYNQLITAAIGGAIAYVIWLRLKKTVKS